MSCLFSFGNLDGATIHEFLLKKELSTPACLVLNLESNSEYSLQGLMLNLQYFATWCKEPTHWKKNPDARKDSEQEKRVAEDEMLRWRHRPVDMNLNKFWEVVKYSEAWLAAIHGVAKSQTWLSDWTTTSNLQEEETKCSKTGIEHDDTHTRRLCRADRKHELGLSNGLLV